MISKEKRFHGYNSLRVVYRHGQTVRGPLTSIKYRKNHKRTIYRAAVVVSKKVDKSAVTRNRIRRRLYESLRRYEHLMVEPYDIVITVFHNTIADIPAKELDKLVYTQLLQAGIIPANKS